MSEEALPSLSLSDNNSSTYDATTRIHIVEHGIFDVAYEINPHFTFPSLRDTPKLLVAAQCMWRFICEVCVLSPDKFTLYTLLSLWIAIAPAISMCLCYMILQVFQDSVTGSTRDPNLFMYRRLMYVAFLWVSVEVSHPGLQSLSARMMLELTGQLKLHFLPRLALASVGLDANYLLKRELASCHLDWAEFWNTEGLEIMHQLFDRIRNVLALGSQLLVLLYVMGHDKNPCIQVLKFLLGAYLVLSCSKRFMAKGFLFQPNNPAYYRLLSLHRIIFASEATMRQTLIKDGAGHYIIGQYQECLAAVGAVAETPWSVATGPATTTKAFADAAGTFIMQCPLSVFALVVAWNPSAPLVGTLAFSQYAMTYLKHSVLVEDAYRADVTRSFYLLFRRAQCLYEILDNGHIAGLVQGACEYPTEKSSPSAGMRLSYRNVSVRYDNQATLALDDISLDIKPGQFVLVVGPNGSGKSSLVNLLLRVIEPITGEIIVDNIPLRDYDIQDLRQSMAFLSQTDTTYPLTVRENITMGVSAPQGILEKAATAAGCTDILREYGDQVIDPPLLVSQSFQQGPIGGAVDEYLRRQSLEPKACFLSPGQKQRVVATRLFYRAYTTDFKLLVVDEPASYMDPIAEQQVYNEFRNTRNTKTTIMVAHRFVVLAPIADVILCMKNGKIAQKGTHAELLNDLEGPYAKLWEAQAVQAPQAST